MKNKFKVPKTIKARNAWFNKLTPDEKKVAIAKDVIEQLDLKKYRASSGTYFYLDNGDKLVKDGVSLQKVIDGSESCKVCAMGAVFASKVRLGNEVNVESCMISDWNSNYVHTDDDDILQATGNVFSEYEMRLMEFYFEGGDVADYIYYTDGIDKYNEICEKVRVFRRNHNYDSDTIMRAIMQNIIDSEGKFTLHLG